MSAPRVAFVNLGCRVNRVEVDLIAQELARAGCVIVKPEEADAVVVNTCAVTAEAEAKTRKVVRRAASLGQVPVVVATGCVASLFSDELVSIAPNVTVEADKSRVSETVLGELGLPAGSVGDDGELVATPTPTGRVRPGIKVQDGCDNRCTYCIVWKARGAARSMGSGEVVSAVRDALSRGAREVVLTGINLGSFRGTCAGGGRIALPGLLELVLRETTVERVRLSSIEPPDVDGELLSVMAANPARIAPFLHVCLQSGCDATLRRMGRVYDTALYRTAIARAREMVPGIAVGCDLIVGFPGETDDDFERSLAFCAEMDFAKMHVFRYSRRPGTPAASAPDQVGPDVMAARSSRMRALADHMRHDQAARRVGQEELVVVQRPGKGVTGGLFDVRLDASVPVDALVRVRIGAVMEDGTLVAVGA